MSEIKVTSEELLSTSSSLATGAQNVAEELARLRGLVESLIGAGWVGTASGSFNELWQKWGTGANQVQQALEGISQMLAAAGNTYQQTEDQLASQLKG
jgi:WXG100 family type VII secretion target